MHLEENLLNLNKIEEHKHLTYIVLILAIVWFYNIEIQFLTLMNKYLILMKVFYYHFNLNYWNMAKKKC